MVRRILFVLFVLFPFFLHSQEEKQYVNSGVLRAQATFAAGDMLHYKDAVNLYLHGDMGYYLNEKVSLRGDGYFFLGRGGDKLALHEPHSVFAGAFYHFGNHKSLDPYLGLQPGLGITTPAKIFDESNEYLVMPETQLSPLLSGIVGLNFYGSDYFHLFVSMRYLKGNYISYSYPLKLDELRFSAGLGWNFDLSK